MKYNALFVTFEKAAKFEIVVCCKLKMALYGLIGSFEFPNVFYVPSVDSDEMGAQAALYRHWA